MVEFDIALRDMEAFLDEADFCISYKSKEYRASWVTWEIIANTAEGNITITYHDKESDEDWAGQLKLMYELQFDDSEKFALEVMRRWGGHGMLSSLTITEKGVLPNAIFRRVIMPNYGISELVLRKEFERFLFEINYFEEFKEYNVRRFFYE